MAHSLAIHIAAALSSDLLFLYTVSVGVIGRPIEDTGGAVTSVLHLLAKMFQSPIQSTLEC